MSETIQLALADIDELRNRLERRNHLLDVVRKAYHRDVFVIRDRLLRMRNGEPLETSLLASVSSIDLRDDFGFLLFSPHECEMKLKPCHYCGGRVEVVHHESSRIMSLRTDLENVQSKVCQLEDTVNQHLSTIDKLRDKEKVLSSSLHESSCRLQFERYRYEQLLSEYIIYKRDSHRVTRCIDEYERVTMSFDKCSRELAMSKELVNLISHELTTQKSTSETLQSELQLEKSQSQELSSRCASLELDLTSSNIEKTTLEGTLSRAEKDSQSLSCKLIEQASNIRSLENDKSELDLLIREKENLIEAACETEAYLKEQILDLKRELVENSVASDSFEELFNKYKEERIHELHSLTEEIKCLKNMNTSYITLIYDRCLLFLRVFLENEIPMNKKKDIQGNAFGYINDCLNKCLDSNLLDWSTLLSDDGDRRQIFGNISNRLISDSNALIKLISTLHERRRLENSVLRRDYDLKRKRDLQIFQEKLAALESLNEEKRNELVLGYSVCSMAICDAQSTRIEWKKVGLELSSCRKTIDVMSHQLADYISLLDRLQMELAVEKEKSQTLRIQLENSQKTMSAYETSIEDLEKLLGRTSSRFASLVAKEKQRTETNVSRGIQVSPVKIDFEQQTDFILQKVATFDKSLIGNQQHAKLCRTNY